MADLSSGVQVRVSRKRVERLIREQGLKARRKKSGTNTTESKHSLPVVENLLNRDCSVCRPGEQWVFDITYLRTSSGLLYLTVILDLWDRTVIGWACSEDLEAGHVVMRL
jgi:transposase InsO family protein